MGKEKPKRIITQKKIVQGLCAVGLKRGDSVLVHSSLKSLGHVRGGAKTVIRALMQVVGSKGHVLMPTFEGTQPYDPGKTPSPLGIITNIFWRMEGVKRSLDPLANVAAWGPRAEEIVEDHQSAPTSHGKNTPYDRFAKMGGYVLLMGVDQDRNTMLHTAEELLRLPYLKSRRGSYKDPKTGKTKTVIKKYFPGPHRNFIGLEPRFRKKGIIKYGKIGDCVIRLLRAEDMIQEAMASLREDPFAFLCNNEMCEDCQLQRGDIYREWQKNKLFSLVASSSVCGRDIDEVVQNLKFQGIEDLELDRIGHRNVLSLTADHWRFLSKMMRKERIRAAGIHLTPYEGNTGKIMEMAKCFRTRKVIVPLSRDKMALIQELKKQKMDVIVENMFLGADECSDLFKEIKGVTYRFHPGNFARCEEKPFLESYTKSLKNSISQIAIDDSTFQGEPALPGQGNAEIKEMISVLRSSSFKGEMILGSVQAGHLFTIRQIAQSFWKLMDE